jgi:hypothetical protein
MEITIFSIVKGILILKLIIKKAKELALFDL